MKIVAIVQARMGSTRLPGKVMEALGDDTVIGVILKRLTRSKHIDEIIVATPDNAENQELVDHVKTTGFDCEKGSEDDVLSRYFFAAQKHEADIVVRITGDCPFIDPKLVDDAIQLLINSSLDYVSNSHPPSFPDGLDVEVFTMSAFKQVHCVANSIYDREHVTPFFRGNNGFKLGSLNNISDNSDLRWTLDEADDLVVIKNVFKIFHPDIHFSWRDILMLQENQPDLFKANQDIKRNEGAAMSKGQKLYRRAKKVIPGGTMLLSKRPEMFLPEYWPAYYSKASGCNIWDLEGKKYIDMSIMGIGTNLLGYGHPEVDNAVSKSIINGNMSTFNCPEEVFLAERLVELHPWAEMVRFCRSGGEANAVAVRIARAATGKDKVAVCGYHGWHDWYLAANLRNGENLQNHLLPGLEPLGVPGGLSNSIYTFNYNKFDELEKIVQNNDIGVIKMEVERNIPPEGNFLQKVRDLADAKGIVLIFDECTSGFRETFGGLHTKYGVNPDMAMFGKALGNGYAITAIMGRRAIMEAAQNTFISSTFWTERIGPTAALKTLEIMEQTRSWEIVTNTGTIIRDGIKSLSELHDLNISQWGLMALTGYTFKSKNALSYKTYITQEMLKKGYLASNSVYVSTEHTATVVDKFLIELEPLFKKISKFEKGQEDISQYLDGQVCHSGFSRLN